MRVYLSMLLLLLLLSCDKHKDEDTPPTPADPCGIVAGIHHTDNMGVFLPQGLRLETLRSDFRTGAWVPTAPPSTAA